MRLNESLSLSILQYKDLDILSKSKNSAFLGMKMKGKAVGVINENMVTINE